MRAVGYPLRAIVGMSLATCLSVGSALAQTPFAGEDFDMGATNGGLTALTEVFIPDNSRVPGGADQPNDTGNFSSSGFDLFGETSRGGNDDPDGPDGPEPAGFVPFDILDDSTTFATDAFGIVESTKVDRFVALADTVNDANPNGSGEVTAAWTFDISGRSNISLAIDMAMIGDFDGTDEFTFEYSIDGGSTETAFQVEADEDNADVLYAITMEAGPSYDFYSVPTSFFSEATWTLLTTTGPVGNINYHEDDNGTNGDLVAQDGFLNLPLASGGTLDTRAYMEGNFNDTEEEVFKDPLFVNGDSTTGTQLTDDFTTQTVDIVGTGDVLTLTLSAVADGSLEYFLFDNILLSESPVEDLPGDTNGDGLVGPADLAIIGINWDPTGENGPWTRAEGDLNADGAIGPADLAEVGINWNPTGSEVAIPEPAAALLALGFAVAGLSRRS